MDEIPLVSGKARRSKLRRKLSAPVNLVVTPVSGTQIQLAWSPPEVGIYVDGYYVTRDSILIATTTSPGFIDSLLVPYTEYLYEVRAFNRFGGLSSATPMTGCHCLDVVSPSPPSNLTATAVSGLQVDLAWTASTDDNPGSGIEYKIYRNGSLLTTVVSTSYTDNTVSPYAQYTYDVLARDDAGNESTLTTTTLTTPTDIPGNIFPHTSDVYAHYGSSGVNLSMSRGTETTPYGNTPMIANITGTPGHTHVPIIATNPTGKRYEVRVWVKAITRPATFVIGIVHRTTVSNWLSYNVGTFTIEAANSEWTEYVYSRTIAESSTVESYMAVRLLWTNLGGTGTMLVDGMQVREI